LEGCGHSYAAGAIIRRKNNEAHDYNENNDRGIQTKEVVQAPDRDQMTIKMQNDSHLRTDVNE
jgi:hypothetical protein